MHAYAYLSKYSVVCGPSNKQRRNPSWQCLHSKQHVKGCIRNEKGIYPRKKLTCIHQGKISRIDACWEQSPIRLNNAKKNVNLGPRKQLDEVTDWKKMVISRACKTAHHWLLTLTITAASKVCLTARDISMERLSNALCKVGSDTVKGESSRKWKECEPASCAHLSQMVRCYNHTQSQLCRGSCLSAVAPCIAITKEPWSLNHTYLRVVSTYLAGAIHDRDHLCVSLPE